jgi:photosystem II stability/assembly factor-like uncharacterized protein
MSRPYWIVLIVVLSLLAGCEPTAEQTEKGIPYPEEKPSDWFYRQRAFPDGEIDRERFHLAVRQQRKLQRQELTRNPNAQWTFQGPMNVGGRITALDVHPDYPDTIWVGAASGGVFRSYDRGQSFASLFDEEETLSIGDLDIAPSDPNIIYIGTGEANAGGGSLAYDGYGIYKSTDGGNNWQHLGLENAGSIGRLEVHPQDPDRVYVAAMGFLFDKNEERGLYRTTDGGTNWERVLYLNDSTGVVDVVLHPEHPDTIYAAAWERKRRPGFYYYGGESSGIYRSYDGGDSWEKLDNGLPGGEIGRIGLALMPSDPNIIYAQLIDRIGHLIEVYRTQDGGDSWQVAGSSGVSSPGFMWWFGRLFPHPQDPETVYLPSLSLHRTTNGGASWGDVSSGVHVDQHDLYVDPNNPDYMVLGNDGGLYISENGASSWTHMESLPITQFYTCEVDESDPLKRYGGTQDNGTQHSPDGLQDDWVRIWLGDGFRCLVDPEENNYVYVSSQYGSLRRSSTGATGFQWALQGVPNGESRNWSTPYEFNPLNSRSLYYGAKRLYKTTNRAAFWSPISGDLTGPDEPGNLVYGTITSIAVSPVDTQVIWIGTDNGLVWKTEDEGGNWQQVDAALPQRWVTRLAADPVDTQTAYVTFSGYQYNEYLPHVFKTTDGGQSWQDISSGLPEVPVNELIIDPDAPGHLYLTNDVGVYVSYNAGNTWASLGHGLPPVVVSDLRFHSPSQELYAGTYGRGLYSLALAQVPGAADALSGQIRRMDGMPLPNVDVGLQTANVALASDDMGQFTLTGLAAGQSYTLRPGRDGDDANGVSTGDLILTMQHILGRTPFDSPYQFVAADANASGSVTTLDMIAMRKIILGIDTAFANSPSWRFVPSDYVFPTTNNPLEGGFPEERSLPDLPLSGATEQDFIGIKIGDLNLDAGL